MTGSALVVVRVRGVATLQDHGRPGHMHEGLAPGGALVRELHVRANRAAHNPDDAVALELAGELVVRAEHAVAIATSEGPRALAAGEELAIASGPARRVTYLAVRGGLAAPLVLGGRGTQRSAGLGALVRAGDRLEPAGLPAVVAAPAPFELPPTIALVPGPDRDAFPPDALARLCAAPYRISPTSDRVGTRLEGAAIPRVPGHVEISRPLVRGALEVPADGAPIVLGPEHPTTGGYPVLAVIAHADQGAFAAHPLGGHVRFRVAP